MSVFYTLASSQVWMESLGTGPRGMRHVTASDQVFCNAGHYTVYGYFLAMRVICANHTFQRSDWLIAQRTLHGQPRGYSSDLRLQHNAIDTITPIG